MSTDHNLFEEKEEPKRNRTEVLLMSLTARPNRLIALSNIRLPFSSMAGLGRPLLNLFMSHLSDDSPLLDVVVRALTLRDKDFRSSFHVYTRF